MFNQPSSQQVYKLDLKQDEVNVIAGNKCTSIFTTQLIALSLQNTIAINKSGRYFVFLQTLI